MVEFKYEIDYGYTKAGEVKTIPEPLAKRYQLFGIGNIVQKDSEEEVKETKKAKTKTK